jgi:hypothetical protein
MHASHTSFASKCNKSLFPCDLFFKSYVLLSEIALQVAANTAYLCNMVLTLGYYFRDGFTGQRGCSS